MAGMNIGVKGCVINRIWFEQAQQMLTSPQARCWFYESIMRTSFGMEVEKAPDAIAATMFAMVKPYVAADIEKYTARCETNRANALKRANRSDGSESLRPLPNASDPNKSLNNINTNTNTNNNTNTNTNTNLSAEEQENKEKWDCMGIIFAADAADITAEVVAFWNYYDSLGWRNKNGSPIVRKTSCARMWRLSGALAGQMEWRPKWHTAFKTAATTSAIVWTQVKDVRLVEDEQGPALGITTNGGERWVAFISNQCAAQLAKLLALYGVERAVWRCI